MIQLLLVIRQRLALLLVIQSKSFGPLLLTQQRLKQMLPLKQPMLKSKQMN